jgi:hypothetical protein
MAAGEQARARSELLEQRDRVLDTDGPLVVKRRWNLQLDPSPMTLDEAASGSRRPPPDPTAFRCRVGASTIVK